MSLSIIIVPLLWFMHSVIALYRFVIIAAVIMNLLITFQIMNSYNRFVLLLGNFLYRLTEPVFQIFRRILPPINGIDVSPILVLLMLGMIEQVLVQISRAL